MRAACRTIRADFLWQVRSSPAPVVELYSRPIRAPRALHGFITKGIDSMWIRNRALRTRDVFHKLQPPPLGCALTIRHLFLSEGAEGTIDLSDYAWIALHRPTIDDWYERYVVSE